MRFRVGYLIHPEPDRSPLLPTRDAQWFSLRSTRCVLVRAQRTCRQYRTLGVDPAVTDLLCQVPFGFVATLAYAYRAGEILS
jgi:hypothetical protein